MSFGAPSQKRRTGVGVFIGLAWFTLSMSGCHLIGGGGSEGPGDLPPSDRQGGVVYHGSLELEGGRVQAGLEIGIRGPRDVWGALETTTGLRADGGGRLRGSNLRLQLAYGGDCPGTMVLDGEWDQQAGLYQGTVEASDCTGAASGTFLLSAG